MDRIALSLIAGIVFCAWLAFLHLQTIRDSERNALTRFLDRYYSIWFDPTRFPLILMVVLFIAMGVGGLVLLVIRLTGLAPGIWQEQAIR